MLIQARCVLPVSSPPIPDGMVRIADGKITEVGADLQPLNGEPILELPDSVLTPGLINAHTHLEYTGFKGALFPGKGFTEWIRQINAIKQSFECQDFVNSTIQGMSMSLDSGTTSLFNIVSFPDILNLLPTPRLRVWWFLELIDIRTRISSDETLLGALNFFEQHPDWLGGFGLSPHAPYTASIELYRLARHCSENYNMPFTTHIAESVQEQEMFLHAAGPLHDFLKSIGRNMEDCGQGSALSHLLDHGVLNEHAIAVHLNYIQQYDWQALRDHPLHVVHCPKCHEFFGHARFPMERLLDYGANICIGTDSMASNDSLDLRSEIRHARRHYPDIPPSQWLAMVTTAPARAIGQSGLLGQLSPGAHADLAAFPLPELTDPCEAVIQSRGRADFVMIDGKTVLPLQQPDTNPATSP